MKVKLDRSGSATWVGLSGTFCRTFKFSTAQTVCVLWQPDALRQAKNGHEFIQKAATFLPKPIEIIAGGEEARLIYLGVSHTMANTRPPSGD